MSTSCYQSKLKGILHAKTQEGKTFKTRIDGSIIWDDAAEAALLKAVPENFEFITTKSRDGLTVWRGIAARLDVDAKHEGSLSDRYWRLTAAERNQARARPPGRGDLRGNPPRRRRVVRRRGRVRRRRGLDAVLYGRAPTANLLVLLPRD